MDARQKGLSLLELLVAFVIMAIALGVLYKASGANARAVGDAERYQRAVFLVHSLLEARDGVPPGGWNASGQSAGYEWAVRSQPYATDVSRSSPAVAELHQLSIVVTWMERGQAHQIEVNTLRPQRKPVMVSGGRP